MIIEDKGRRFDLQALGAPKQSDGGYVWQNFRLKIEVLGQTFTSHDVWLTSEEVSFSKLEICQQKCKPLIGVIEKTGNRPEGYGRPQYVNYTCVCR